MGGEGKHAALKQRETGSSIHLPFDQLETMHLAFNLAIAPGQRERSVHGCLVPSQSLDEELHCRDACRCGLVHPTRQAVQVAVAHQRRKLLSNRPQSPDATIFSFQAHEKRLLIFR